MKSFSKSLIALVVLSALLMCVPLVAFAIVDGSTQNFAVALPPYQQDVEVGTVSRENGPYDMQYFTITIRQFQTGNAARAWTENSLGKNLSDPNEYVYVGEQYINYFTPAPKAGTNVTLNMDNPNNIDYTNSVIGSWSPN